MTEALAGKEAELLAASSHNDALKEEYEDYRNSSLTKKQSSPQTRIGSPVKKMRIIRIARNSHSQVVQDVLGDIECCAQDVTAVGS